MDYLQKLTRQAKARIFFILLVENLILIGGWLVGVKVLGLNTIELAIILVGLAGSLAVLVALNLGSSLMRPIEAVWQTVMHLSPNSEGSLAPKIEGLGFGRELVASLSADIYALTDVAAKTVATQKQESSSLNHNFIAQNLPLPLIVVDPNQNIKFANEAAGDYIGMATEDMAGKNIYMVLDMSFPSSETFDAWLKEVKLKNATAAKTWERVRLNVRDSHPVRLFDLAAYYNRGNTEGNETILVMFDHTKMYSQDDQAISFMALSVHELRTPLTLLRGYIEVFEDELEPTANEELKGFMQKMHAQAEQLMDYVNNILNVARVDDDQLELRLQEGDWASILKNSIEMVNLRAKVRGISLKCQIQEGLPTVGVDRLSISEVISNLIDNAIKYSGDSNVINVQTYLSQEGLVETIVQDYGKGIPSSVIPNLFTKFYRDHRNRAQIGGTGLGLYLCKAIVTAHGGTIWVRSKEGEGSIFGFTLIPYTQLEEAQKHKADDLTRNAHGWIKNHSLYRR